MPIYEYSCDTCHDDFEVRRSFSDSGIPACPTCNGTGQVRRRFSAPAIVFKGSGFYVNDSRGKSSTSKPAASTNDTSADSGKSSDTPAEGKAKTDVSASKPQEKAPKAKKNADK